MFLLVIAYVIGAIPGGYLISRHILPYQTRLLDALPLSPASRALVERMAPPALSIIADMAKGAAVVAVLPLIAPALTGAGWRWLTFPLVSPGLQAAGVLVAAVLGHILSVYICGWGGKGGATILGGFLVISPPCAAFAVGVFCLAAAVTRAVWVGTLCAICILPACILLCCPHDFVNAITAFVLVGVSFISHYHNLARSGTA